METTTNIWQPISIDDKWLSADTSIFDDLAPSWYQKREEFQKDKDGYSEFLSKLKRQHAIETGVIEKLYSLDDGVTQTLIKNGFVESFVGHKDTNISPSQLMAFLGDHLEAIDFIYEIVHSDRSLSKGFLKELHQLITKTQTHTEAVDTLGNIVQIPLLKGEFKKSENNPKRQDGSIYLYCPPIHVEQEIDNLIQIYTDLSKQGVSPIIIAAWVHHAFTQIHPFQDGNGRIARLLASLTLIKNGLLPFTVRRSEKAAYITALEKADNGNPKDLVAFFALEQKKSIEVAINFRTERKFTSFDQLAELFNEKVDQSLSRAKLKRQKQLDTSRTQIFKSIYEIIGEAKDELRRLIPMAKANIGIGSAMPNDEKYYYHTNQIIEYAKVHDYYFNKALPRGWFIVYFNLSNGKKYDLIISVHHYGYEEDVIAVGGFLEFIETLDEGRDERISIPIKLEPFTISLTATTNKISLNLKDYIHEVIRLGLSIIINEIN